MSLRAFNEQELSILSEEMSYDKSNDWIDKCVPIVASMMEETCFIQPSELTIVSKCEVESSDGIVFFGTYLNKKCVLKRMVHESHHQEIAVEVLCGLVLDRLGLPNVMKTYGLTKIDGIYHAVFSFVEGKMLSEMVDTLSDEEKNEISRKILDSFKVLRESGYSHGCPHTKNIMITKDMQPILIDYSKSAFIYDCQKICAERDNEWLVDDKIRFGGDVSTLERLFTTKWF